MEQLANNAVTYLSADITSGATSIGVVDGSVFPSSGTFTVRIGTEFLKCTARTGNTLTVTRGEESTIAVTHTKADPVAVVLTKRAMTDYIGDGVVLDTWANKPAAGRRGRLFFQSDGPYMAVDDGAAWNYRAFGCACKLPSFTSPAWNNQGSSTIDTTKGMYHLVGVGGGLHAYIQATPSPPFSIVLGCVGLIDTGDVGLVLSSSTVTSLITFGVQSNGQLSGKRWTNTTSLSGTYSLPNFNGVRAMTWLKYDDDNTNRTLSIGVDGENWTQILSEVRTTFVTPDRVGIYTNGSGVLELYSWSP